MKPTKRRFKNAHALAPLRKPVAQRRRDATGSLLPVSSDLPLAGKPPVAHRREPAAPRCRYFQKICIAAAVAGAGLLGCRAAPFNRVEVTDIRSDAAPQLHHEDFDESYFRLRDGGLIDLVLRKQTRATADQTRKIVQTIVLRSYWKPFPGRTYANHTMLNANLCYVLVKGDSAIGYEGGGFFQYAEKKGGEVITGKLEGGDLQPLRRVGGDLGIFERARISGKFKARRDDRRTTQIMNRIDQLLGPPPRIEPAHRGPDY